MGKYTVSFCILYQRVTAATEYIDQYILTSYREIVNLTLPKTAQFCTNLSIYYK